MGQVTFVDEAVRTVEAEVDGDGRVLVDPGVLADAIGWTLKPEGLCRGEVCVPVRDRTAIEVGDRVDVAAVAGALRQPIAVDAEAGYVAVALPAEARRAALDALHAPDFTLPDLDGRPRSLDEWRGSKRLLVAFASW